MKIAANNLTHRRIAWEALSDLYLDTDTSLSRDWRVERLLETPYTVDELETILAEEVHPVCRWNLMCIAGEWAGFDSVWLEERILHNLASRPWFPIRSLVRGRIRRDREWIATKDCLVSSRSPAHLHPSPE